MSLSDLAWLLGTFGMFYEVKKGTKFPFTLYWYLPLALSITVSLLKTVL